jgi:hypothetical protein
MKRSTQIVVTRVEKVVIHEGLHELRGHFSRLCLFEFGEILIERLVKSLIEVGRSRVAKQ